MLGSLPFDSSNLTIEQYPCLVAKCNGVPTKLYNKTI